jgi:excisionase family DNA binding protein
MAKPSHRVLFSPLFDRRLPVRFPNGTHRSANREDLKMSTAVAELEKEPGKRTSPRPVRGGAIDSHSYPPRGLSREEAARYVGVGTSTFDRLVEEGRMPRSLRVGNRVIWDRLKIEAAFSELDDGYENEIDCALRLMGDRR